MSIQVFQQLSQESEVLDRLINGFIAYLKRSKQGANEPGVSHSVGESDELYIPGINDDSA